MATIAASPEPRLRSRWPRRFSLLLSIAILGLAAWSLIHVVEGLGPGEIGRAMQAVTPRKLWLCGLLTAASFAALGCYDALALGVIAPRKVSPLRGWFCGAVANALSNTLGFHAVTATAIRYRLLHRSGLGAADAAAVTAWSWTTLAFGFASVFSLAIMVSPGAGAGQLLAGLALVGALLLLAGWLGPGRRVTVGAREFRFPSGAAALGQMALGAAEMSAAIGALYVLMPAGQAGSFAGFSAVYIGAVLLGIASHAPGGIGVFEAAMLALSSSGRDRGGVLAALLLYRVLYNFVPFILAALAFAAEEILVAVNSRAGRGRSAAPGAGTGPPAP